MLRCVVGHRWDNLGAQLPLSTGTTLQRFLGFLIFWAVELPFCSLRPNKLRWLYTAKAWLLPPSVLGLLIYCAVQSRGHLASNAELSDMSVAPGGSALVWAIVASINSAMGNWVRCSVLLHLRFTSNLLILKCSPRSLLTCPTLLAMPPTQPLQCGHTSSSSHSLQP